MTLFYLVCLHELGHALHHMLAIHINLHDLFLPRWHAEKLAQHFARTCIEQVGKRAEDVFMALEIHQPEICW